MWREQEPVALEGCLLRRVLEVRAQGRALPLPPPELGFMEGDLVNQVTKPVALELRSLAASCSL